MSAEETEVQEAPDAAAEKKAAEPEEPAIPRPNDDELPAVLEALMFASTQPLSLKRLSTLTGGVEKELLDAAIGDLKDKYERPRSGLMLMEVAGGWQIATRPSVADWVLALHKHRKKNPISPAVMETLAIVAYKQPLVRAEIEAIRGVDCGAVMRALLDAGLVEVLGQKEVPGRPSLYGTTDTFLKTFGLRNLEELPSLSDLHRIMTAKLKGPDEEEEAAAENGASAEESAEEVGPETEAAAEEEASAEDAGTPDRD